MENKSSAASVAPANQQCYRQRLAQLSAIGIKHPDPNFSLGREKEWNMYPMFRLLGGVGGQPKGWFMSLLTQSADGEPTYVGSLDTAEIERAQWLAAATENL